MEKVTGNEFSLLQAARQNKEFSSLYKQDLITFAADFHMSMVLKHLAGIYNLKDGDQIEQDGTITRKT